MIRVMNMENFDKHCVVNKLKKCVIAGAAALTLSSCASLNQTDKAIMYKEAPHIGETSLNTKMVKKQKPVDEEFLRQESEMLDQVCFNELFDLELTDNNRDVQQNEAFQKLAADCQKMKPLTQRAASQYKRMEQATIKKGKVSAYEILSVDNQICSYHYSDVIKATIKGVRVTNQGLPEDTNLNAVRAAYQHRMHKFLDAKTLVLSGAVPSELVAQEKYELGYGVFEERHFVKSDKEDFIEQAYDMMDYVVQDVVNYAMYEFRHNMHVENPAALEKELNSLFKKMEEGMNAYGYQGIGAEKDMQQFAQARQKIVHILSQAPEMFGEPQDIDALMFEIGSGWAMLPLLYDMHKKGIDFTRFNPTAPVQQSTEPVMGK